MMGKKGCIISLLGAVALALAMLSTCPKAADHKEAIAEVLNEAIEEKVGSSDDVLSALIKWAGKLAINKSGELAIDKWVTVEDYYVVSIGRLELGERRRVISVGVFNHVFTMSKNDVLNEMRKYGI